MTEKKTNRMSEVAQAQLAIAGALDRMDRRVNAWLVLLGEDQDHSITAQLAREDMATIRGAFATHNNGTSFFEVLQQLETQSPVSRMDARAPSTAPAPKNEQWICLLCKSGRPGFHSTLDDRVTPCPNGKSEPAREPLKTEVARRMVWSASSWLRSEGVNEDDVLEVIAAVERFHGIDKCKG